MNGREPPKVPWLVSVCWISHPGCPSQSATCTVEVSSEREAELAAKAKLVPSGALWMAMAMR